MYRSTRLAFRPSNSWWTAWNTTRERIIRIWTSTIACSATTWSNRLRSSRCSPTMRRCATKNCHESPSPPFNSDRGPWNAVWINKLVMTLRAARWGIGIVGGLLVLLAIVAGAGSRTASLRQLVIDTLADRLDSEVQLETFSVDTFPTVHVTGSNLIIRHKGRKDVPPLVSVASFQLDGGLFGLLSRPRRFRTVSLTGLQINIPPGFKKDTEQAAATSGHASDDGGPAAIVVDTMEANDAALTLIPKRAGKEPRVFAI